MMYDELIKALRLCALFDADCKTCPRYSQGVCYDKIKGEAADAIEELQKITTHYEEESKGWWLAACDAKEERERLKEQLDNAEIENIKLKEEFAKYRGKNRWIPVTERLPEEEEVVLVWGGASVYTAKRHNKYGELMWWKMNSRWHYCNPTHWMPLPEQPDHIGDITEMVANKKCIDCQRDCQMIGCDMKACASYEPPKDGE